MRSGSFPHKGEEKRSEDFPLKSQPPQLRSFRLKNFKAVRDSSIIRFTPLTVFIGNNGSGKSSIIEGLETFQAIVGQGLDKAIQQWRGIEHVWHKGASHKVQMTSEGRLCLTNPIAFDLQGRWRNKSFTAAMTINMEPRGDEVFIQHERLVIKNCLEINRTVTGQTQVQRKGVLSNQFTALEGESIFVRGLEGFIAEWQFISLIAQAMGTPTPRRRTSGPLRLTKDGSNIAEYLLSIRKLDQGAFDGIVETLQYILPYARDLQPALTSELERTVYLQMTEGDFKVPGWLLSTGTLRIVALLALLRHPTPPP